MSEAIVGGAIIAIVEGLKRQFPQINGIITIIVAGILGILAGVAGFAGLNWLTGLAIGLASAGTVTVVSKVGGN